MSNDCKCESKQEAAKAHVAARNETDCGCDHDYDDNSINPCGEFHRQFMEDCGGNKNRCCAVWPDGTSQHYDIAKAKPEEAIL